MPFQLERTKCVITHVLPCRVHRFFASYDDQKNKSQQWYVRLALKLLWERQLGSASAVEGYVNVLPAQGSFDTLIHWTDQELDMLNYSSCAASAKRQRAAWDKLHQVSEQSVDQENYTFACAYAYSIILSRPRLSTRMRKGLCLGIFLSI